jgi:hypothetical protein
MLEELGELLQAMSERDELNTLDSLADLLYVVIGTAVTLDLPAAEAFEEVHASNMTKEKQPADPGKDRVRSKGPNYRPPNLSCVLSQARCKPMGECLTQEEKLPGCSGCPVRV